MWQEEFSVFLKQEFENRKSNDIDFSLNKYAKEAGVSASTMSELISGKRGWQLSEERAVEIVSRLSPREDIRNRLFLKLSRPPIFEKVTADEGKHVFLTSWKHRAVMIVLDLPRNMRTPEMICRRFGLTADELQEIFTAGLECGVLERAADGVVESKQTYWETAEAIPKDVLRRHQIETIDSIRHAVETIPADRRDYSTLTIAGSSQVMEEVRKEIKGFYDRVHSILHREGENDEVFHISVALFPLSKEEQS